MIDRSKLTDVERDLVEGFDELLDDLRAGSPIEKKYTCRHVVLELQPHAYTADCVKETRKLLNASQALFAQFLGVSVKSVRSWEQGAKPNGLPLHGRNSPRHGLLESPLERRHQGARRRRITKDVAPGAPARP